MKSKFEEATCPRSLGGKPLRLDELEIVDLDVLRLQRASDAWIAQHEALRTVVTMEVKLQVNREVNSFTVHLLPLDDGNEYNKTT